MERRTLLKGIGAGAMMTALGEAGGMAQAAANDGAVFELRIYHTYEGKLDALLARFRDHTMTILKRHGIESVAYWTPTDEPLKVRTLVYMLRHPNREAADANWAAFRADPEWKQVSAASEVNGKLVEKIDSTFLKLTDFSPRI